MRTLALLLLCAVPPMAVGGVPAIAASIAPARDVGVGDPLRKPLLNALRPTLERDLGQRLVFVVHALRAQGNWAFADVEPQTPAGKPVDFLKTRHAERMRLGMLDGGGATVVLLRRSRSGWEVLAFAVGPTDVAWDGWDRQFGAPRSLFEPRPK